MSLARTAFAPRHKNAPRPAWKSCEHCDKVFTRADKPGVIYGAFMRLRFCSPECSRIASKADPVAAFWGKVEKGTGCWIWRGGLSPKGYGVHWIGGGNKRAHRYSFELHTGIDPADRVVMHSCDNRACVNPDHLSLGTQTENIADMDRKGRRGASRGEAHHQARITAMQALAIRSDPRRPREIARDYPIGESGVEAIKAGRTWRHI